METWCNVLVYGCSRPMASLSIYLHYIMDRKAFLDQEPPPGYVAGVGRGATGFTTSADTARVRFESDYGNEDEDEGATGSSDEGLFSKSTNRTNEDEEADRIYQEIDLRLQRRRQKSSQGTIEDTNGVVEIESGNGVIKKEFSLFKKDLAKVSMHEWASLPDVGDLTRRNKRQRLLDQQMQRTYAAPDALIAGAGSGLQHGPALKFSHSIESVDNSSVKMAEIEQWEESNAQVGDVEKSRLILASLRRTEPNKADSWIASARLEEQAKNFERAKAFIREGCMKVPHNEKVWIESIRIHRNSNEGTKLCKKILNEALSLNSSSESLWFLGVELENPADIVSKKRILMKALEYLPENAKFWKALVDLENNDEEKLRLLQKSTELCPEDWELWINLINLSAYKDAKNLLNKARKALPKQHKVWITALKLEERENSSLALLKLSSMLRKGISELEKNSASCGIDTWLKESVEAEAEGFEKTCQALIENVCSLVPAGENKLSTLIHYAEQHSGNTSKYIYQQIIKEYPNDIGCWVRLFASLKQDRDSQKQLNDYYSQAIALNPETELFYLMFAKDMWLLAGDIARARSILEDAIHSLPQSENVWLARVKLEVRTSNYARAYEISKLSLELNGKLSARIWYKHIHLLRFCLFEKMDFASTEDLLNASIKALDLFPDNYRLYLQRAQILVELDDRMSARDVLSVGTRKCPTAVEVWCALADIDTDLGAAARARSLLDTAILHNPHSDDIWEKKIGLEIRQKDMVTARQMINKCLKQFPNSPRIWLQNLAMISKLSHRKNAYLDALKLTNNSTQILLGIGVFFWMEGKFHKSKSWFDRAVSSDPKYGDAWGWSYCFLRKNGIEDEKTQLLERVAVMFDAINKGPTWASVVKDHRNLAKSPAEILELVAEKLLHSTVA